MPSALELIEPIEASFVLGPIGLGYDRATDRLLVQLEEVGALDEEGELDRATSTAATSGCTSPAARRRRSASTPTTWSPPAGRRAGGAATRSTPTATSARG